MDHSPHTTRAVSKAPCSESLPAVLLLSGLPRPSRGRSAGRPTTEEHGCRCRCRLRRAPRESSRGAIMIRSSSRREQTTAALPRLLFLCLLPQETVSSPSNDSNEGSSPPTDSSALLTPPPQAFGTSSPPPPVPGTISDSGPNSSPFPPVILIVSATAACVATLIAVTLAIMFYKRLSVISRLMPSGNHSDVERLT